RVRLVFPRYELNPKMTFFGSVCRGDDLELYSVTFGDPSPLPPGDYTIETIVMPQGLMPGAEAHDLDATVRGDGHAEGGTPAKSYRCDQSFHVGGRTEVAVPCKAEDTNLPALSFPGGVVPFV